MSEYGRLFARLGIRMLVAFPVFVLAVVAMAMAPVQEPDGRTARRFHAGPKGRYEGPSEET